jgi:hypothetical protein
VAYGDYIMKKLNVFEWQRQFKEGWEDVQDDTISGQLKMWTEYEPWCAQI